MAATLYFEDIRQHYHLEINGVVTASMLADNVLGLEGLARQIGFLIEGSLGLEMPPPQVLVTSVSINSIEPTWIYRIFFGKGMEGEGRFEEFRKAMMVKKLTPQLMVGALLGGLVSYTAIKLFSTDANIHLHLQQPAQAIGISEKQLEELIDKRISKQSVKRNAVRFVHPSGVDNVGNLTVGGLDTNPIVIESDSIARIPVDYVKDEDNSPFQDFDGVELEFRAVDMDKSTGWWVVAEQVANKRVVAQLAENISPMGIVTGRVYSADITVTYDVKKDGTRSAKRIQVRRLRQLDDVAMNDSKTEMR